MKTAAIIIIGNEILSGKTQDTNSKFIATELAHKGISLQEIRTIPDIKTRIIKTIHEFRDKYDYIFTTGGIGPTHDDITSESVAEALGRTYELNSEAARLLHDHYKENINESRLKMARMPQGAKLIPNEISIAPGFVVENIYVMAGIPAMMEAMFNAIKDSLEGSSSIVTKTITVTLLESLIAKPFEKLQEKYPNLELGSYPFKKDDIWHTSLSIRGTDTELIEKAYKDLENMVEALKQVDYK